MTYIRRANRLKGVRGPVGPAGPAGPAGIGFKLTKDGNYDIDNKQLINVGDSEDSTAAINFKTVEEILSLISKKCEKYIVEGMGLSFSENKKYADEKIVSSSSENKKYVDEKIVSSSSENKKYVDEKIILDSSVNNMLKRKNNDALFVPKCLILKENYDAENKKIINLSIPRASNDAVNKIYSDNFTKIDPSKNNILGRTKYGLFISNENFLKSNENVIDYKQKKLVNVKDPEDDNDVVNKQYLINTLKEFKTNLDAMLKEKFKDQLK